MQLPQLRMQGHGNKKEPLVKSFGTQWERVRLEVTPGKIRAAIALLSLVAMVLAGSAGEQWS
jgi:hypothetical protein